MKFHEYESVFDFARARSKHLGIELPYSAHARFYAQMLAHEIAPKRQNYGTFDRLGIAHLHYEMEWYKAHRPYYKVWPSIIPALLRINLDIIPSAMQFTNRIFLVRFPIGIELPIKGYEGDVKSFITAITPEQSRDGRFVQIMYVGMEDSPDGRESGGYSFVFPLSVDVTINEALTTKWIGENPVSYVDMLKCAIMIHLLADDHSIIQPDVLADDRSKFDGSTDPEERQRLINKARKRGIFGWRIGEQYETIPHFRRPHFALRHTGKGGTVPRIVPVKGAVVHRQKLTRIPTGHMEDDGTEVES